MKDFLLFWITSLVRIGLFLPDEFRFSYSYDGWWGWLGLVGAFGVAWFCVHQFIRKKLWESFFATAVINAFSMLFVMAFSPPRYLIFQSYPGLRAILVSLQQRPFIAAVVMNVFTESCVALLFYKIVDKKRMVMWLIIANVLIMGVGIGIVGKIKVALEKQEQAMMPKERGERGKRNRRLEKRKPKVIKKR